MRHGNAAVCHHDHQIPQAQFEARVPAHAQNDDLSVEVPSFEQIFDRDEPLHLFIIARHPRVCTRTVYQAYTEPCTDMTKDKPFTATFKLEKETKNTVRYAEEAEGRRPVVGTVYIDKYELGQPYPQRIRVTIEPAE